MYKSLNLYNVILYQSMAARDLSVLVDADRELQNAVYELRTDARRMAVLEQNPLSPRFLLDCPAIVGLVADNKDVVDNILLHDDNYAAYLPLAAASPAAVTAIANSYMYTKIRSDPKWSDLYNPGSESAVIAALSLILHLPNLATTHTTFEDVATDADLIARIAANRQALVTVGSSEGAMAAIVADAAAMGILAASQAAMDVLATFEQSRSAIINSAVAMTAVAAVTYATTALLDIVDIRTVAAVPGNMDIILADSAGTIGMWNSNNAARGIFSDLALTDQALAPSASLTTFVNSATALLAVLDPLFSSTLSHILADSRIIPALFNSVVAADVINKSPEPFHNAANSAGLIQQSQNITGTTTSVFTGKGMITCIKLVSGSYSTAYIYEGPDPTEATHTVALNTSTIKYVFFPIEICSARATNIINVFYIKVN